MPRHRPSQKSQTKAQIELFERFVETAGQALGMADLEGRIFYANAALCRMLGEERSEDVYQKDIFAYYDPKTAERLRQEVLPLVECEGQ